MLPNEKAMQPLSGLPRRNKFAVIDIETKKGDTQEKGFTRPFLVGYFDGERFLCFEGANCISDCLLYILDSKSDGMTYYAHNGGSFDWLHFLPEIARGGYSFELMTVSSSIQLMRVSPSEHSKKKGWTFLDSLKLFPAKLAEFCKSMGVETVKDEEFDLNTDEHDPRWKEYLRRDCVSLWQSITRFTELVESIGGELGVTTASTSMRTFRRSYQKQAVWRHKAHHELFRDAYYGGRVEDVRERGHGLRYYDINSSYPRAMLDAMPVGRLVRCPAGRPPAQLENFKCGFVRARVEVPDETLFPVLPYRSQGKLIFPVGRFEGAWTSIELDAAEARGAKVEYLESVWVEGAPIFSDFVNTLYRYRDKEAPGYDEGLGETAKRLLNSLYGKFAMATTREKIFYVSQNCTTPVPEGSKPADPHDPDCPVWYYDEEVDAPYIIPQISAWITALARLRLLDLIEAASARGVVCYYDTDSVITTADLTDLCTTKLGGIKDEGKGVIYDGMFLQPKLYSLYATHRGIVPLEEDEARKLSKITMKGYRTRTIEAFERIEGGQVVSFETLEKIGTMARNYFQRGPLMKMITRQVRTEDKKRVHLADGSSRPLRIDTW